MNTQYLIQDKIQNNTISISDINQLDYLEDDAKECPNCKNSFIGDAIPEKYRHYYGDKTHYYKSIYVEIPGLYDGAVMIKCPFCQTHFRRFKDFNKKY